MFTFGALLDRFGIRRRFAQPRSPGTGSYSMGTSDPEGWKRGGSVGEEPPLGMSSLSHMG